VISKYRPLPPSWKAEDRNLSPAEKKYSPIRNVSWTTPLDDPRIERRMKARKALKRWRAKQK